MFMVIYKFQMFLDDVGVIIAMVAITLLAIIVVIIKVVIFETKILVR